MSYRAIACALALGDVSIGERLVAFSLASYANRAHLAWPSARTAAARAGLGRRQYLTARDRLAERGLIALEESNAGVVVRLAFAEAGPSVEREVNAELFGAVLSHSRARGGARALLAVLAALADGEGEVKGVSVEGLCSAAGLSDRTYRRARGGLLGGGEVAIEQPGGGRGCQNVWRLRDPRAANAGCRSAAASRSVTCPRQLPLVAVVRGREVAADGRGVVGLREGAKEGANPGVNPGHNCTPRLSETPAQTPAETPAPHVRAGRESQNQGTAPPDPPEGGRPPVVEITERFTSARGRSRTRRVDADATELGPITDPDRHSWVEMRARLRDVVGESMFEIWLGDLAPIAVSRRDGALLVAASAERHAWVASRYGRLLAELSRTPGRRVRAADERELQLHAALDRPAGAAASAITFPNDHDDRREAI